MPKKVTFVNTIAFGCSTFLGVLFLCEIKPHDIFSQEQSRQEAIKRSSDENFWAVYLIDTNKLIGNIYLVMQEFCTWELGYVFNEKYQKLGYATEATEAMISYVVENKNVHRFIAMCNPENSASWKLLERLGFRREGLLVKNIYFQCDAIG